MDCFDWTFTIFIEIFVFGLVVLEKMHSSVLDSITLNPESFNQFEISFDTCHKAVT